ncbi:hypothetical protein [Pseudonocardia xishanensis]|uniref:Helix-turn-helix protein n=1 Tax=Pseudonocardia xishanensis TaxID=630995 RepID=A0ABP8RZC8_9PSEU
MTATTETAGDLVATRESEASAQRRRADRRGNIPERLNYLFDSVHAAGDKPYSAAEVARWISEHGGSISSVYILKIRNGERLEPNQRFLRDIARFFCVPPTFFIEDDPAEIDGEALNAQILLRDDLVQSMMRRAARLSRGQQEALSGIIDSLLRAEGKEPGDS